MKGELIRGHAEGVKIPYYSVPAEIATLEKEKACSESELRQTENVTGDIEESTFFEPQRREYLNLIHLMNEQTLKILSKAPEDMKQHERQYVSDTMTINHQAFTAGLYRKVTL